MALPGLHFSLGKEMFGKLMLNRMRFIPSSIAAVLLLSCGAIHCSASDLDSAKRAYHQRDYGTAVREFTDLANKDNVEAQLILGKMYMLGQGVPKDSVQEEHWFRAAATHGDAEAQFFLGAMYLLPRRDIPQGLKWLRLSADQGNQDAQYLVGEAYMKGQPELPRDPVMGDMWLRLAAKNNKEFYQDGLRVAERQMTAEQRSRGTQLAAAWKPNEERVPQ